MELLTPYSLSRGAPSAARPSLQILFRGPCSMVLRTIRGARYSGLRPSPLRGQRRLAPLFFAACSSFVSRSAISPNSVSRSVFNGPADHQGSALFGTSSLTPSGPASPCSAVLRCLQQLRQPLGHLSKFCLPATLMGCVAERYITPFFSLLLPRFSLKMREIRPLPPIQADGVTVGCDSDYLKGNTGFE